MYLCLNANVLQMFQQTKEWHLLYRDIFKDKSSTEELRKWLLNKNPFWYKFETLPTDTFNFSSKKIKCYSTEIGNSQWGNNGVWESQIRYIDTIVWTNHILKLSQLLYFLTMFS